ncbi:MAG: trigger factor [Nitrospinae bacterium]|jgi:trigger factor|nr:trigger factor [Nitrospinota bacterium]MDP6334998.1 trigger factor [Nitrospinaceae bacterium]|tara:strand:- start:3616 stop:4956 length:1341 start_codon:yes stop_codon:yes gene_type:complete
MTVEIEDIDSCKKKIKFDIAFKDYQAHVQSSYRNLARQAKIPGFRPGKAPMAMLEKRFGPEVKKEVMTQLISERLAEVVAEKGFRSVSPPKLLEVEAEEGTDIKVSASVEIVPEFEIADYSKMELPLQIQRVTGDDVDQVINYHRESQATKVQVTDRPVKDKDFIKLDFKGTLNGEPFEGGEGKDHIVQIGSEYLLKDMGDQLIGMSAGEKKDIPVNIPENYNANKSIAGKEVNFHVSVKGIQENQLPELSDDFAKNVEPKNKFESMDDMKLKTKAELEEHSRGDAKREAKKLIPKKIIEMNPIEIPEGLVEEQIRHMVIQALKKEQQEKGLTEAINEEEVHITDSQSKEHRQNAMELLQQELLLDKLATNLNIQVDENELNAEVNNLVRMMGGTDPNKMKKEWAKSGVLTRLQTRIKRDKTLDAVMEKVQIKEEMVDSKAKIDDN